MAYFLTHSVEKLITKNKYSLLICFCVDILGIECNFSDNVVVGHVTCRHCKYMVKYIFSCHSVNCTPWLIKSK